MVEIPRRKTVDMAERVCLGVELNWGWAGGREVGRLAMEAMMMDLLRVTGKSRVWYCHRVWRSAFAGIPATHQPHTDIIHRHSPLHHRNHFLIYSTPNPPRRQHVALPRLAIAALPRQARRPSCPPRCRPPPQVHRRRSPVHHRRRPQGRLSRRFECLHRRCPRGSHRWSYQVSIPPARLPARRTPV